MGHGWISQTRWRVAAAVLLAGLLSACMPQEAPAPAAKPAAPPAASKVAFEPITGLPEARTAVFATELGRSAAEAGLNIVSRESDEVDFRLKGYVTAKTEGQETVVAYVWDIFADGGARVHRITGEERLPAALPDPWQAVTDDALEKTARRTVEELARWLGTGAPVTTAASASARPPGTSFAPCTGC